MTFTALLEAVDLAPLADLPDAIEAAFDRVLAETMPPGGVEPVVAIAKLAHQAAEQLRGLIRDQEKAVAGRYST